MIAIVVGFLVGVVIIREVVVRVSNLQGQPAACAVTKENAVGRKHTAWLQLCAVAGVRRLWLVARLCILRLNLNVRTHIQLLTSV